MKFPNILVNKSFNLLNDLRCSYVLTVCFKYIYLSERATNIQSFSFIFGHIISMTLRKGRRTLSGVSYHPLTLDLTSEEV